MSKRHLYLLALAIIVAALAAMHYKWNTLRFPISPDAKVQVWTVQAHIEYQPRRGANTVTLQLPWNTPGWIVLDQRFVAREYSRLEERNSQGREVQWATRRALGEQDLYYRATIVRSELREEANFDFEPVIPPPPQLEEPYATAAQTLLGQVRERSSNTVTFARELLRRLAESDASDEVALLREHYGNDDSARTAFVVQLLAERNIPARMIHGLHLGEQPSELDGRMLSWLLVHDGLSWHMLNPRDASEGMPRDLCSWSPSGKPVLAIDGDPPASLEFSLARNLAGAIAIAERRLEVRDANLVRYALLSLPLQA